MASRTWYNDHIEKQYNDLDCLTIAATKCITIKNIVIIYDMHFSFEYLLAFFLPWLSGCGHAHLVCVRPKKADHLCSLTRTRSQERIAAATFLLESLSSWTGREAGYSQSRLVLSRREVLCALVTALVRSMAPWLFQEQQQTDIIALRKQ